MFNNLKVGPKLFGSSALLILMTVIVAFSGYLGMDSIMSKAELSQDVRVIVDKFNETRQQEKNYIISKDSESAKKVLILLDSISAQAQKIRGNSEHPEIQSQMDLIQTQIGTYRQGFADYLALDEKSQKFMEEMKESSNVAFSTIKEIQNAQGEELSELVANSDQYGKFEYEQKISDNLAKSDLTNMMVLYFLNARKFEKEFLLSRQDKYLEKARASLAAVVSKGQELRELFQDPEMIAKAEEGNNAVTSFTSGLNEYVELLAEQDELEKQMVLAAQETFTVCSAAVTDQTTAIHEQMSLSTAILIGISLLAVLIGLTVAFLMARGFSKPLAKAVEMLKDLERGHIDVRLNMARGDEIGQMAKTMDIFADSLQHEIVDSLVKLSHGDITFTAEPHDNHDIIRTALKRLSDDLNHIIGDIRSSGAQIASGATQISDSAQSLSQGATESAASLEEITASMSEMASQTRLNAENASQANSLSTQVKELAGKGSQQMEGMVSAMEEIRQSSENITKIIKVIDEIAFQTNLLALNAAVEAARAGQHGKGFAVVAEEVRNLAARSAKAAQETAELIAGSAKKTEAGSEIAARTSNSLQEIVAGVEKVSDLVAEIAAASNEQAQGISQVNQGLGQIDQVTQQNTANAEESAAAAEELSGQAMQLQQMLGRFQLLDQLTSMAGSGWDLNNQWTDQDENNAALTDQDDEDAEADGWPSLENN